MMSAVVRSIFAAAGPVISLLIGSSSSYPCRPGPSGAVRPASAYRPLQVGHLPREVPERDGRRTGHARPGRDVVGWMGRARNLRTRPDLDVTDRPGLSAHHDEIAQLRRP